MSQPGKTIESIEAVQAHLQQQLAEQALLLQVSQTLATSFELDNTMPQVVDCALKGTKADDARLVRLTRGEPAGYPVPAGPFDRYRFGIERGWRPADQDDPLVVTGGEPASWLWAGDGPPSAGEDVPAAIAASKGMR